MVVNPCIPKASFLFVCPVQSRQMAQNGKETSQENEDP